jgi:hypothetical protein
MAICDHNEGVEKAIALQQLLICVSSHGVCPMSNVPMSKASRNEGKVHENISREAILTASSEADKEGLYSASDS